MSDSLKNIIGGIAAIFGMAAFSIVYYYAKEKEIFLDGFYWISSCVVFSASFGILAYDYRKKIVGCLYLLVFWFFISCLLSSLWDLLVNSFIGISRVYYAIIATFILTAITYITQWIRYH